MSRSGTSMAGGTPRRGLVARAPVFVAAAMCGRIAIHLLLRVAARGCFYFFGFCCLAGGILGLLLIWRNGAALESRELE